MSVDLGATDTPTRSDASTLSILCLSDSDTRLKWTIVVAEQIVEHIGERVEGVGNTAITLASMLDGAVPSDRQLEENEVAAPYLVVDSDELPQLLRSGVDVVVVNTVGSRLARVIDEVATIATEEGTRPLVVTGYAGLVYEKHVEGLLWRLGADVICCNSAHDHRHFTDLTRSVGIDPAPLVRSGAAVVVDAASRAPVTPTWPPRTIVFAVQPDVPRRRSDRVYLLERLVSYARRHPDRRVVVKLRSRPDEETTHRERHHYEDLYRTNIVDRPPNLVFEYGHMAKVLAETDLLLTVSSTAALEALVRGVHVGILTDVGVGESLGNHAFVGSGMLISMSDVDAGVRPEADPEWCSQHGMSTDDRFDEAVARLVELLRRQRSGDPVPVPDRFVNRHRTPRLVDRVDDVAGRSGQTDVTPTGVKAATRRVLRGPLRGVYRRLDRWAKS